MWARGIPDGWYGRQRLDGLDASAGDDRKRIVYRNPIEPAFLGQLSSGRRSASVPRAARGWGLSGWRPVPISAVVRSSQQGWNRSAEQSFQGAADQRQRLGAGLIGEVGDQVEVMHGALDREGGNEVAHRQGMSLGRHALLGVGPASLHQHGGCGLRVGDGQEIQLPGAGHRS